jgi:hypothetical protein
MGAGLVAAVTWQNPRGKNTMELTDVDMRFVATRLPRDVRELLSRHAGKLFLGGGFIRAVIAGEEIGDIDLFGTDPVWLRKVAEGFSAGREGSRLHISKNAITLLTPNRMTVQFITRWTFDGQGPIHRATALVQSFDFTVCQAAVWRAGTNSNDRWESLISDRFYIDLAARRLTYTSPVREEEAGGSMLRVIKYVKRGYTIQVGSLGAVIARLTAKVHEERLHPGEEGRAFVITGLLREVDPSLVIDGIDVLDDHDPEQEAPLAGAAA